jgi:hypothetical protein
MKNYPDEIMCMVNKHIADYPEMEWRSVDVKKHYIWVSFADLYRNEIIKEDIHVKSIVRRLFSVREKREPSKGWPLNLEIWELETSTSAERFFSLLSSDPEFFDKPQAKECFIYKNILIILATSSVTPRHIITEEIKTIVKTCFE